MCRWEDQNTEPGGQVGGAWVSGPSNLNWLSGDPTQPGPLQVPEALRIALLREGEVGKQR